MFYKTSHYPIYTTKTTPYSKKKIPPQFPIKKKKSKKKTHYMHETRVSYDEASIYQ